jgi:RecB family exonuclease
VGLILTRAPAFSAALPHALAGWRERGGLLVVPRREAAAEAMLAEAEALGAVLGREAVTPAGLRGRVADALGRPEPERPSRIDTRLGLREVLASVDLTPFGPSSETPGFLAAIERAIAELRGARVSAEAVRTAAVTPIDRALAEIHAAALAMPHPADAAWQVADMAADLDAFPPVTVAGFDDLDPAAWALLAALGRVSEVDVVVPFDPERPAFEARRERQARWAADAEVRTLAETPSTGPVALARRLFSDGPPLTEQLDLRLVGAAGTRGMLRAALEEVLRRAGEGIPLARIALVVPRLAELRDDLERLLEDWEIPARVSTRVRALEAPLLLALTHLLHLGRLDGDAPGALDHLLGWLRTPYSGADPDEVDRFEAHARRGGLAGRRELIGRWDGPVIAPARHLVAAAKAGPRSELAALVRHGEEALRRAAGAHDLPSRADRRDRAALAALAGLAGALPDGFAEPEEERSSRPRGPLPPGALGELLADLTFTAQEGPVGGLAVHDFASIRGHAYDVVVIAGLDGDGYPGRPSADPLLGPLRDRLPDLPPRAPGTSESRLRFVHAVDAARRGLALVRRVVDDDGREVAPSPYWVEALRVAGRPIDALDVRAGARGEIAASPADAPTEREALRAIALAGGSVPGPLADAVARRVRALGVPADAFHDRERFRVTELEQLVRCPYGWFRDSYLAPQELERAVDAAFEGSFGHEVLDRLYARMIEEGVGGCGPGTLERYRAALEEILPAVAAELRPRDAGPAYEALTERLRRHLRAMLGREAALGSALVPTVLERRMADTTILADVAPGVVVSGQIDRLDVSPDGAHGLVVDYKRSLPGFSPKSEDVTKRLQLPLYAKMAETTLGLDFAPIGGLYVGLLEAGAQGAVREDVAGAPAVGKTYLVSEERWAEITDEALTAVRDAVGRLRAGELTPPPADGCSRWCHCGDLWR